MDNIMTAAGLARTGAPRAMDGKVALITGSTSGIGLGIANALAAAGAMIVLNGFGDRDRGRTTLPGTRARGTTCRCAIDDADMSKPAAIRDMVERVGRSFGPVDILVNNAGIQHVAPIEEFPPEKWDAILAINLSAAFHTTRAVLPEMKRRGCGRIVNIASAHGLIASPFKSAYVAAKHGIVGLTKVVALEAAEFGVTCNAVCPGYVWTPLVEKQIDGQAKAHGISRDAGDPRRAPGRAADQALRHRRGDGRRWRRSCAATPLPRSPASPCRSTAAGRPTDMTEREQAEMLTWQRAPALAWLMWLPPPAGREDANDDRREHAATRHEAGGAGAAGWRRAGRLPGRRLPGAA